MPAGTSNGCSALAAADPAAMLSALPHAAWLVAIDLQEVLAVNAAAAALFGREADSLVGARADQLAASPEDLAWWQAAAAGDLAPLNSMAVLALADGRVLHAQRSITPLPNAAAAPGLALVLLVDHSERRQADAERETLLADLRCTLEATADGLLVTDLNGRVRSFNRRFATIWSLPRDLLLGHDDADIATSMRDGVQDPQAYAERLQALLDAPLLEATDKLRRLDGTVFERVTRPLWRDGRPQGRVWSFRDLSERLAAQERIETLATTDALTLLPNRPRMVQIVDAAAQGVLHGKASLALLVVDLDRFRQINDSLGRDMGDRVLQQMARRLAGCLRADDRLARLGSDQFAVLLATSDAAAAEATARRMLNAVAQPCNLDNAAFTLTCSIGIALAPSHGRSAEELLRHAEGAMLSVKHAGRSNVQLHRARTEVDRRSSMRLDHAMRQALVSGRFRLMYQPQIDLADGRVVGAEALLRWRDPELGDISPARFIPVAEDSGFIVPIGDWVLAQAVRQSALWHQRGQPMPVAVNVSALQFQQSQFVDRVASVLAVSGLPPHLLELELTESILVHEADEALARLRALKRLGVSLSIDDFGTGYSSLAYLKRFPIGKLKIDRSFVHGLPADETDAGIVRAILQMARALDMRVIAEGVETEAQREFLVREGCAEMQGYLYAPALDPITFEQRVDGSATQAAPRPAGAPRRMRLVRA